MAGLECAGTMHLQGDEGDAHDLRRLQGQALEMSFPRGRNQHRAQGEEKTLADFGEIEVYLGVKTESSKENVFKLLSGNGTYVMESIHGRRRQTSVC